MTFKEYYDSFILEMPHISLDLPDGNHKDIDLELEYIKTIGELKDHFKRILSGEEILTHRGHSYKLNNHEEKMAFLHEIKNYLENYLSFKFKMTLVEFMKLLGRDEPTVWRVHFFKYMDPIRINLHTKADGFNFYIRLWPLKWTISLFKNNGNYYINICKI